MDYNHITSFLDKFKIILFKKEETKNIIIKTISDEINHTILDNSVKIKNGVISVQGSPILRNEILIHKKQILIKLKNNLIGTNFLDII